MRHVKETEKELSRQLALQREQYEAAIQRHLAFIDQVTFTLAFLLQMGPEKVVILSNFPSVCSALLGFFVLLPCFEKLL